MIRFYLSLFIFIMPLCSYSEEPFGDAIVKCLAAKDVMPNAVDFKLQINICEKEVESVLAQSKSITNTEQINQNLADTDPQTYAEMSRLAKIANTPVDAVSGNLKDMQRQRLIDRYVQSTQGHQVTQSMLKDPGVAPIIHDDLQNMTGLETALTYMGASGRAGGHEFLAAGAKLIDAVQPFTPSDQDLATLYKNDPEGLKRMREQSASGILPDIAKEQTQKANSIMEGLPQQAKDAYGNLEYFTTDYENAAYLSPVKVISDSIKSALALTIFLGLFVCYKLRIWFKQSRLAELCTKFFIDLLAFFLAPIVAFKIARESYWIDANIYQGLFISIATAGLAYIACVTIFGKYSDMNFYKRATVMWPALFFSVCYWLTLTITGIADGKGDDNILVLIFGISVSSLIAWNKLHILKDGENP